MNLQDIINEINKDVDDSLERDDIIGWVNRCIDDLSPIAKKEEQTTYELATENAYELPDNYFELFLVMVEGCSYRMVPLTDSYSRGYKVWGNVLSLQNQPDSGQMDLYYYRRLNHVADDEDIPEIEPSFHDLFILYTVAYNRFAEDEPEQQANAMSRYHVRKQEFQDYILRNNNKLHGQRVVRDIYGW